MKKYLIIALIATTIGTSLIGVPQTVSAKTDSSVIATATSGQGWVEKEGKWYYQKADGTNTVGWDFINGEWYHFESNGEMSRAWQVIDGNKYFFKHTGEMIRGWAQLNEEWCYFNQSGVMQTGWQKINGDWYFFEDNGPMATGWNKIYGNWYYLKDDGAMITGWQWIGTAWYYLNDSGAMLTGWQQLGSEWYYLNGDGSMAKDTTVDGWWLDSSGVGHKVLDEANIDWDLTNKLNNSEWMYNNPSFGKPEELKQTALDISLDRPISNLEELKKGWRAPNRDKFSYQEHKKVVKEVNSGDIDINKLTLPITWKKTNFLPNPDMGFQIGNFKRMFAYYDSDKKVYQIIYVNIRLN
ncbi:N-acetylmuramoyl-L-alanine amidase family protein [Clostridium frigidicarnis]|uniref:Putative cell wall binding repeat-containing protein n=1 Tax=Clostridium frigidicarnis TaxID=84698 RepID=A0A1I1AKB6_9CLOT|nr:N-acetylmuramoyl-L-alanine amidase family protein [Clostridium frigidicarnis]SFB38449.1 Putative cell wall binding repeat-containing protein [Clostridium frigidicarnis]